MGAITKGLSRSRAVYYSAYDAALNHKGSISDLFSEGSSGISQLNQFGDRSANKQRYALYRGWVYAAINAIAMEGSFQSPNVGRLKMTSSGHRERSNPSSIKELKLKWQLNAVPKYIRRKSARQELEVLVDHPLLDALENPNSFQHSSDFVYSFIANLALTGFGYIIGEENESGRLEFFSIPTTWITPIHKKGAFAEFKIKNPNNPSDQKGEILDRSKVAFAYLPSPSDPLSALSPTQAEANAIKIDDHIQSSQQVFFGNGIFPSVIITIGNNPHPDVPGGAMRPRLTGPQKRQVIGAISKMTRGVANYGNPAIIDGAIEKIERLSATQTEMGWEKSEKTVRTRILSAFGVHPFILGEEIVGSYAQAYVVEKRFCRRVNVYLNLLSTIMSEFIGGIVEDSEKLLVWWEECKAEDPEHERKVYEGARDRDDISQNELRSWMGLPPDEDRNETLINRQSISHVLSIARDATKGDISVDQAQGILIAIGMPTPNADQIAGKGRDQNNIQDVIETIEETVSSLRLELKP